MSAFVGAFFISIQQKRQVSPCHAFIMGGMEEENGTLHRCGFYGDMGHGCIPALGSGAALRLSGKEMACRFGRFPGSHAVLSVALLFSGKWRASAVCPASGGWAAGCLLSEKRKKSAAAFRGGMGGLLPSGGWCECAFHVYADAKAVRTGDGRSKGLSMVAAAVGGGHGICSAEVGGEMDRSEYTAEKRILHGGCSLERERRGDTLPHRHRKRFKRGWQRRGGDGIIRITATVFRGGKRVHPFWEQRGTGVSAVHQSGQSKRKAIRYPRGAVGAFLWGKTGHT